MIERRGVLLRYPFEGVKVSLCYPGASIVAALPGSFFHAVSFQSLTIIGSTNGASPGLHSALLLAPMLARKVLADEKRWAGLCGWLRTFSEGRRATWP
jgi:hypothetical protein